MRCLARARILTKPMLVIAVDHDLDSTMVILKIKSNCTFNSNYLHSSQLHIFYHKTRRRIPRRTNKHATLNVKKMNFIVW